MSEAQENAILLLDSVLGAKPDWHKELTELAIREVDTSNEAQLDQLLVGSAEKVGIGEKPPSDSDSTQIISRCWSAAGTSSIRTRSSPS
jgi:hypothetical protein